MILLEQIAILDPVVLFQNTRNIQKKFQGTIIKPDIHITFLIAQVKFLN